MSRGSAPLVATVAASIAAAALANAYATCLLSLPGDPMHNLTVALETLPDFASSQLPLSSSPAALATSLLAACAVWAAWAHSLTHRLGERVGEEHGSARWETKREGRKFLDASDPSNNIIFTESFGLAMERKDHDRRYERNRNVLVIGGSGSGKTRGYVEPNIMQMNSNRPWDGRRPRARSAGGASPCRRRTPGARRLPSWTAPPPG